MSSQPHTSVGAWPAGARAAGTIVALGYLLGLVRGPVMAVVGGLALVTLARCLAAPVPDDAALAAALAVLAGAVGVGALRWGVVDLGDLRGIQGVLGPTLLVGPAGAAAACWVATVGAVAALAAWLATARAADGDPARPVVAVWAVEALAGSLLVVSVFWGPSIPRGSLGGDALVAALRWLGLTVVVAAAAAGGALVLARHAAWRWAALGAGAVCAAAGAALVARVL
ncbi:MAG TPA: hypothetical protein VG318_15570 [Actinomycetota bacterium]|nr:hypothetical protein [Actinomycetota bacterium]